MSLDVHPRDVVHRDLKLAPDGARTTIASGLRVHKHLICYSGRWRHLRNCHRSVAPPCDDITSLDDQDPRNFTCPT